MNTIDLVSSISITTQPVPHGGNAITENRDKQWGGGEKPQLQVNSFNLTHIIQIATYNSINFDWRWVRTNISKPECHLLEKDLTANYVIQNGGRLPWKHGLPKFKEAEIDNQTGFETFESLLERRNRAIKHLQDRINSCK
jgi:hypothetical protein